MVGLTIPNIMKIKFANGFTYEATDLDDAIAKCLADGNDPFNPQVVTEEKVKDTTKKKDEHTE